jgi:hypothetical protein
VEVAALALTLVRQSMTMPGFRRLRTGFRRLRMGFRRPRTQWELAVSLAGAPSCTRRAAPRWGTARISLAL